MSDRYGGMRPCKRCDGLLDSDNFCILCNWDHNPKKYKVTMITKLWGGTVRPDYMTITTTAGYVVIDDNDPEDTIKLHIGQETVIELDCNEATVERLQEDYFANEPFNQD
jgi:hypothetical protein